MQTAKANRRLLGWKQYMLLGGVRAALAAPWTLVFVAGVLGVGALWYTATHLTFTTSRNALVASRTRPIQAWRDIKNTFTTVDYLTVVVEPPHVHRGKQFVDALVTRLQADTQHFTQIVAQVDTARFEGKKLLFLSADDLRKLRQRLEDAEELLTELASSPGLETLLTLINQEISKALVSHLTGQLLETQTTIDSPSGGESLDVSFLTALFTEMDLTLAAPHTHVVQSPWGRFFLKENKVWTQEGYLTAADERFFFVLAEARPTPGTLVKYATALNVLRAHVQDVLRDFPDVRAGVTGEQALAADEMLASQRDTAIASLLALVGVGFLFIVTFRQFWHPLLVVFTLVIAICWTLGLTTLSVGHLSILSIAFAPMLIGLGIDFGIHMLARYHEERALNHDGATALLLAYRHTGPSVIAAALTTALAFLVLLLVDFPGLAELGWIAGSGILLCLLSSFTVLPALLTLYDRRHQVPLGVWAVQQRDPVRFLTRLPRTTLSVIGLLTTAGMVFLPTPRFDYNLLNLQAHGTESVVWEYRLLNDAKRSAWYALSVADSLDELYRKKTAFAALPEVERVESLASLLPADQTTRLALIAELPSYVTQLTGAWGQPVPLDLSELDQLLAKLRFKLQRDASAWQSTKRPTPADLATARAALVSVQERLQVTAPETARHVLERFQQVLMDDIVAKLTLLRDNLSPTPITQQDIPAYMLQRFVGQDGRYLLHLSARHNIWEREPLEAFVTQLQEVDADITGAPVIAWYAMRQMQQGYTRGGLYALGVILGIVFLLFRRLKPTLFALLPLLVGGLWTAAGMAIVHVPFNLANLMVLPVYMGLAIDSGIHLVNRALESPETAGAPLTRSTGKAVLLSALTTIVGFGSLMLAKHYGIFSLGQLFTLAIGANLVAAFVVLPNIMHLFPLTPQAGPQAESAHV